MSRFVLKLNRIFLMLAVAVGIIFLVCAFTPSVPNGVEVDGIAVGGMGRTQAAELLRGKIEEELKEKKLEIIAPNKVYTFSFPEIYYKDNIYKLLKSAKKGDKLTVEKSYYLCGISSIAPNICRNESISVVEPYYVFSSFSSPFTYFEGIDGKEADGKKLIEDISNSLKGSFEPVTITFKRVKREKTMGEVKRQTQKLASFTTNFDSSNISRTSNIRLASNKLNGTVLEAGKTLSFNDIVGARVKERGFLPAKIIENGEFVEGVGGGVCQVSTTLYNAAVLSGLKISEYHPHSLAVGYVPPSRDAMVSGTSCDLKITNPFSCPVFIRAKTVWGSVTFDIYGLGGGARYSIVSEVTGVIEAPEEKTDDPEKAKTGKDGLTSVSYLTVTEGNSKKTVLFRKDKYGAVKKVVYEPAETRAETEDAETENGSEN